MRLGYASILAFSVLASSVVAQKGADSTQLGAQAAPMAMLEDARVQYRQGNFDETVRDLRATANILRIESSKYVGDDKFNIDLCASDLEKLANGIKTKEINTQKSFDQAVAIVAFKKAKVHMSGITKTWTRRDLKATGDELLAAAHAAEHALEWLDNATTPGARKAFAEAKYVSAKLVTNKGWTVTEVDVAIKALAAELEKESATFESLKTTH